MNPNEYPEFNFQWQWIRDKQIGIEGDRLSGIVTIWDEDDNVVAMYAYEIIENKNE